MIWKCVDAMLCSPHNEAQQILSHPSLMCSCALLWSCSKVHRTKWECREKSETGNEMELARSIIRNKFLIIFFTFWLHRRDARLHWPSSARLKIIPKFRVEQITVAVALFLVFRATANNLNELYLCGSVHHVILSIELPLSHLNWFNISPSITCGCSTALSVSPLRNNTFERK